MYEHIVLAFIGITLALFAEESFIRFLGILSFVLIFTYIVLGIFGGL